MRSLSIWILLAAAALPQDETPPGLRVLGSATFQAPSEISAIAFSPDSRHFAAGTHDSRRAATGPHQDGIVVWDLESAKIVDRIPANGTITWLQYLSDGRRLVFMTMKNQGNEDGTTVWDLQARRELLRFKTANYYGRFGISPDEKILLAGDRGENYKDLPGVLAWNLTDGKPLPGLEEVARQKKDLTYRVSSIIFTADGTKVACVDSWSGAQNNAKFDRRERMSIWEWKTSKMLHEWIDSAETLGHGSSQRWLPGDEQLLLANSKQTCIVKAADGTVVRKFNGIGVASPDLSRIHCYSGGNLVTYDFATGEKQDSFAVPSVNYCHQVALSRDGRWFVASANNQSPVLVDLKNRKALSPSPDGHLLQPYGIGYSADGRLMVFDGGSTRVYDDASGRVLTRFKSGFYYTTGIEARTRDGRLLLAKGGEGGRAELWDTARGELLGKLKAVGGIGGVESTWMSPDGAWAATKRERSGTLQFYDLKTGEMLGKVVGPEHSFFGRALHLTGCEWNAAGDKVFLACNNSPWFHSQKPKSPGVPDMMNATGVFDPRTGALIHLFETPNEKVIEAAEDLAYYAPEDLVYVAGGGFYGLWKGADGKFLRELDKAGPRARFTPDGRRLVSPDGVVLVGTGKLERSFTFAKTRVPSPSGARIAAFDEDQILRIHDAGSGAEVARRDLGSAKLTGKILSVAWHPAEAQLSVVLEKQPAVLQVDLPELARKGDAAAERIRELRQKNTNAAPMKVDWK